MTTALDLSTTAMLARNPALQAPSATANVQAAKKASQQFEAVFISQFLGQMFADVPTDGPFGGGPGEEMFRSLMIDEYGKQIEQSGGFGLAAPVAQHLLKLQEGRQ